MQGQINDVAEKAWGSIAASMAVAALPQPMLPDQTMLALAGSRFSGATGAAIGVSYALNRTPKVGLNREGFMGKYKE